MMNFIAYLINGISLGSIYAIIALGYTMVYGIAKMLNFAHGDIIMLSSYLILTLINLNINPIIAVLLSSVFSVILGIIIEKTAYKPLRECSSLSVLITTIGVSYFLQNIVLLIFGSNTKSFVSIIPIKILKITNDIHLSNLTILSIVLCIIIMLSLIYFINKTSLGQAMLAVSEDKKASILMGINPNKTISITFAIGSFLASIAGALLCSMYPILSPTTGSMPGIKAFIAAVIGGIGSISGAFVGGIILGILENLTKIYISTQFSDIIVFFILILMLLIKPNGIFGKKYIEKV